jgi:hypothetical protein
MFSSTIPSKVMTGKKKGGGGSKLFKSLPQYKTSRPFSSSTPASISQVRMTSSDKTLISITLPSYSECTGTDALQTSAAWCHVKQTDKVGVQNMDLLLDTITKPRTVVLNM